MDPGGGRTPESPPSPEPDEPTTPLPWHFKLLVAAIVLYLGWRGVQGVEWLVGRF